MNPSPYNYVWITGDAAAQKYLITSFSQDRIGIRSLDGTELTLIKSGNEWKIQNFEAYPFLIFFEKKESGQPILANDPDLLNIIIVGKKFDGRSQYVQFWRAIRQTKAGNLDLVPLPEHVFLIYSDPGQSEKLVIPQELGEIDRSKIVKTSKSRARDSAGQLKYKDWRLFRWEPDQAYFRKWLSD